MNFNIEYWKGHAHTLGYVDKYMSNDIKQYNFHTKAWDGETSTLIVLVNVNAALKNINTFQLFEQRRTL